MGVGGVGGDCQLRRLRLPNAGSPLLFQIYFSSPCFSSFFFFFCPDIFFSSFSLLLPSAGTRRACRGDMARAAAASGCVREGGMEGVSADLARVLSPRCFAALCAKVLLISLIECLVGSGPALLSTHTSLSATPTPLRHPTPPRPAPLTTTASFRMFPWELLSPFIITSQRLATSTLTGCQRLLLPVKLGDGALNRFFPPFFGIINGMIMNAQGFFVFVF